MSDERNSLRALLANDQAVTEINEVFGPIVTAYKVMRGNDIPASNAGSLAEAYGTLRIERHFGISGDMFQIEVGEDGE